LDDLSDRSSAAQRRQGKGALRENSGKPPVGGGLSALCFLGLLALGFRASTIDLRQLPAESSAVSGSLEYGYSRITGPLVAALI